MIKTATKKNYGPPECPDGYEEDTGGGNSRARKLEAFKRSALDGERPLWRALSTFMDLVFVSLLFFACSLPVVTIGAASTAAYDTVVHCIRRKEPGLLARFFSTFRNEFFRSLLCTMLFAAALGAWGFLAVYVISLGDSPMSFLFMVNAVVLGVAVLGSLAWVFPVLSRFQMGAGKATAAALRMVFARLPATLLLVASLLLTAAACYIWMFPLMFLPGLMWLFQSVFIERAFAQYT